MLYQDCEISAPYLLLIACTALRMILGFVTGDEHQSSLAASIVEQQLGRFKEVHLGTICKSWRCSCRSGWRPSHHPSTC